MIRTLSLAAVAALFAMPALACEGFEAHEPYARTSTMMSQSGAAFMVIHNHGTTDCHITAVRSEISVRTELHTHIADANGVMRMVEVEEGFPLPAGGTLLLERGSHHVMFLGLNEPMRQGLDIPITLVFADGSERVVIVPVDNDRQPMPAMGQAPMQGHGHAHGHGHGAAAGN